MGLDGWMEDINIDSKPIVMKYIFYVQWFWEQEKSKVGEAIVLEETEQTGNQSNKQRV